MNKSSTKKRKNISTNITKTKKCRPSQQQLQVYCKEAANTFNQFEHEFEKTFKTDLKRENTNIEKELIKMFKTPI